MTQALTILNTAIRQDAAGRYCLNDFHRAAGGAPKDQPTLYFRSGAARGMLDELEKHSTETQTAPLNVVNGGASPGTYVVKELVYAYAMWLSPAFHLKVIRAFDAMVTAPAPQAPGLPDFSDPAAAARAWALQYEQAKALCAEAIR